MRALLLAMLMVMFVGAGCDDASLAPGPAPMCSNDVSSERCAGRSHVEPDGVSYGEGICYRIEAGARAPVAGCIVQLVSDIPPLYCIESC